MFFDDFEDLARTAIVGVLAYLALVGLLRISGKRTLSQLYAFDLVVTVALGSTLATVLLSSEVSLSEGLLALGLLIALQYAVAFTTVHTTWAGKLFKSEPSLVLYEGKLLHDTVRAERLTEDDVRSAVRSSGLDSLEDAKAVVLEADGSLSVVPKEH